MSGANAISGIALVGALVLSTDSNLQSAIAFLAVLFASINVFGGYLVTNRMLKMFKKK
jgi:NAD(P) transhydrogenase subunit alpha